MGNAAGTAEQVFIQLNGRRYEYSGGRNPELCPMCLLLAERCNNTADDAHSITFKKESRQQSRARCGLGFAHKALDMFFYGLLGNLKPLRDLFVGVPLDQPLDHRPTANRQLKPTESVGD